MRYYFYLNENKVSDASFLELLEDNNEKSVSVLIRKALTLYMQLEKPEKEKLEITSIKKIKPTKENLIDNSHDIKEQVDIKDNSSIEQSNKVTIASTAF